VLLFLDILDGVPEGSFEVAGAEIAESTSASPLVSSESTGTFALSKTGSKGTPISSYNCSGVGSSAGSGFALRFDPVLDFDDLDVASTITAATGPVAISGLTDFLGRPLLGLTCCFSSSNLC
jgi:hypothetical protein